MSVSAYTTWSLLSVLVLASCAPPPLPEPAPGTGRIASGFVFEDENRNGVRDGGESGISDVAVSNGFDVVRSDRFGRYRIRFGGARREDATLFVIKPSGWMTPVNESQVPRFSYVHRPLGSPPGLLHPGLEPTGPLPDSVDFPLHRRHEPGVFRMILFGDTQPYTQQQVDYLAHDIIEELVGADASFGMTLGDLVGDDLALFEPLNRAIGRVGIPWYSVIGNHDLNFAAESEYWANETYARVYGPSTYAFEVGRVHFVVLDDVVYDGANPVDGSPGGYRAGLTERQLTFVERYLAGVSRDRLVVIAMHIPLVGKPPRRAPERRRLLEILSGHPHTFSVAAHTHTQLHAFFGPEEGYTGGGQHHHLVQATSSGSWWLGQRDEVGLPHATMRCGAPNGYSIVSFDGADYAVRFKAARQPADHQMNIHAPEIVSASQAAATEVLVNVFAGSERSTVEMRLGDGDWTPLERVPRKDPFYTAMQQREEALRPPDGPRGLPPAIDSPHIWAGPLPANPSPGTWALEVRTADMFGEVFTAHRLLRIE